MPRSVEPHLRQLQIRRRGDLEVALLTFDKPHVASGDDRNGPGQPRTYVRLTDEWATDESSTAEPPAAIAAAERELAQRKAELLHALRAAQAADADAAQAQAAIFDMARAANAASDSSQIKSGDVQPLLGVLNQFDELFAVLNDDDAAKMKAVVEWAKSVGREKEISPELLEIVGAGQFLVTRLRVRKPQGSLHGRPEEEVF